MSASPKAGTARPEAVIVLERTYRAPVAELWELWTTRDGFESWWGPEGFRVEVELIEARLGGALVYDMIAETPEAIATGCQVSQRAYSRFVEFRQHERLKLVDLIDSTSGPPADDRAIEVDFRTGGGWTTMLVTVHPHIEPSDTKIAIAAFRSQLARLDRRFTQNRTEL
jgi:uncharacterized protein YndB with AHSA1/START domain